MGYGWSIPSHTTANHFNGIDLPDLLGAVYVVYTQFGALILPALILSLFYNDYRGKTIIFYKAQGISALLYYLSKVVSLVILLSFGTLLFTTLACALYGNFSPWIGMFLQYEFVIIAYTFIMSLWGFLFGNFIVSFFVSLATWLTSILIAVGIPPLSFVAFYDESSPLHAHVVENLGNLTTFTSSQASQFGSCLIYDACLVVVCLVVVLLSKKRWVKNGV